MAIELEKLLVTLGVDRSGLTTGLNQSIGQTRAWSNVMQGIFQGVGQAAFRAIVGGVGDMARGIGESINAASDLNESVSKTGVVFGQSGRDVVAWGETLADTFGQSKRGALEAAGTFGNLFTSLGVTRKESARMSMDLVELASDLASFNNVAVDDVLIKLRAGIVGETEPLRTLGVNLSAATVEAKAMAMGLAESTKALTEQDKVMARYALILDMTSNAQGDFARTADGAANAQRRVDAQLDNYRTMAGQVFLPFKQQTLGILAEVLQNMAPYAENIMSQFAMGLARGITAITPVLVQLATLFTFWLKPGSPPRLLPDLTRWGVGAANAYLQGWTKADFGIFSALASGIRASLTGLVSAGKMPEGGLFGAILGSRSALASAVAEFAATGRVSESTFAAIGSSAGDAGQSVEALARAYFGLQGATEKASQAQSELTAIQDRYNNAITPITGELSEIERRRQEISDRKRIDELKTTISRRGATADEKELAKLELRQIELRRQQGALEAERDTAVDAAQMKLEAAQAEQEQAQTALDLQRENIAQQQEYNGLLAERMGYERQMAAEAKSAADAIRAAQERAQAETERLTDAQLAYRLAVADTPGQITILRGELEKYNPQQVEYWQTLTQIQRLEEALAKSRAAGGGGVLPDMEDAGKVTEGVGKLTEGVVVLTGALTDLFVKMGLIEDPKLNTWFAKTADQMAKVAEESQAKSEESVGFFEKIWQYMQRTLPQIEEFWKAHGGKLRNIWDVALRILESIWTDTIGSLILLIDGFVSLATGNWQRFFDDLKGIVLLKWAVITTVWDALFAQTATAMYEGGKKWIDEMWRGFQENWDKFKTWVSGLTMPWAGWELPGFLQRNSPSELEQSLMGTADALRDIQGLGGGLSALGAMGGGGGGSTSITYSPVINVGAGVSVEEFAGALRRSGDDFMRQWRARGNG